MENEVISRTIPHLDGEKLHVATCVEICREVFDEVERAMALHKGMQCQHEA
jgi:hypothetical protein